MDDKARALNSRVLPGYLGTSILSPFGTTHLAEKFPIIEVETLRSGPNWITNLPSTVKKHSVFV
jgi:hypothetical protein